MVPLRRPQLRLALVAALAIVSAALVPRVARAQPQPPDAAYAAQFREARVALDARRWREAVARFEALRLRSPHPSIDYNLGMALRGLGHPTRAVEYLRAYAASLGPDAPRRGPLLLLIESLEGGAARVRIERDPPDAAVVIDGVAYPAEMRDVALSAGPHEFAARAAEHLAIARIEVIAVGDLTRVLTLRLEPVARPLASGAPVVPPSVAVVPVGQAVVATPRSRDAPAAAASWVGPTLLLGGSAVGAGVAAAFYVLREEALGACGPVEADGERPCPDGSFDRAVTYNAMTDVTLGVAGVAAISGALWVLVTRPWRRAPAAALSAQTGGTIVRLTVRF